MKIRVNYMKNHKPFRGDYIDMDQWKNAPYGKFTSFIQSKYDRYYHRDEEEIETHLIEVKVYGQKVEKYEGVITLEVSDEDDINDVMNSVTSDEVVWDSFPYDEDDYVEISDWESDDIKKIDKESENLKYKQYNFIYKL